MGDALWWAFITFYSVGYGDISPTTWAGKLVASCCTVFGMIVFNLPSGIVGAGLALQVSKVYEWNPVDKVYGDKVRCCRPKR